MGMEVKGKLRQILKLETGVSKAGKEWQKQDFVILTEEQFPKTVCFTLFGDKIPLLNVVAEGMLINVHFNLESRDFNGKFYHNINCWKIDVVEAAVAQQAQASGLQKLPAAGEVPDVVGDEGNDLPF